jgi:hypothetical protein
MQRLLISFFFSGFFSILVSAPTLGLSLKKRLNSGAQDEISIIAKFSSSPLDAILSQKSPAKILRGLQNRTLKSKNRLLKAIKKSSLSGALQAPKVLRSLWIANSVAMRVQPEFLRDILAKMDELESLRLDKVVTLPPVVSTQDIPETYASFQGVAYGLKRIGADRVWRELGITGKDVVVGLLDTGVAKHAALDGKVLRAKDFASFYDDNTPNDGNGHGTHTAGTIGGREVEGRAIGVAPGVSFIVGKIFNDGGLSTDSSILDGLQWMTDPDGDPETNDFPRVISNSWGSSEFEQSWWDAIALWRALGIVPIFAAGNSGPFPGTIGIPAVFPNVLAIGASDGGDEILRFSSRGPNLFQGELVSKPDIVAPGSEIVSASHLREGYVQMSGTSMAVPHVAGVVALMLEANPSLSPDDIFSILQKTAHNLGVPGKDVESGHGRIDALKAVRWALKNATLQLELLTETPYWVQIMPGNYSYHVDSLSPFNLALSEGSYEVEINVYGFLPVKTTVLLEEGQVTSLSPTLKKAALHTVNFLVLDQGGVPLKSSLRVLKTALDPVEMEEGEGRLSLPEGNYQLEISGQGLRTTIQEIQVKSDRFHSFVLQKLKQILIVEDDGEGQVFEYFKDALDVVGVSFDHVQSSEVSDLMGYPFVLWYAGRNYDALSEGDSLEKIRAYTHSGGRLIITGQDVGYVLDGHPYYKSLLGAKWLWDASFGNTVSGQGLELTLVEGDAPNAQPAPDVILEDGGEQFLRYDAMGSAGLSHRYGDGKLIYLGFGIEGVEGVENRAALLRVILEKLAISEEESLKRIRWAYQNAPKAYHQLLESFELHTENRSQIQSLIKSSPEKEAFRPLMDRLLNLSH